jgi:uncharacterized membrane protein YkvA (DUF1232 family)
MTEIRHQVLAHCDMIRVELRRNEFLDIDLAQRLADAILLLLNDYATYSEEHQLLIAGAARYFIHAEDADPDVTSILGFDDDVAVLNYVLALIGRQELRLDN